MYQTKEVTLLLFNVQYNEKRFVQHSLTLFDTFVDTGIAHLIVMHNFLINGYNVDHLQVSANTFYPNISILNIRTATSERYLLSVVYRLVYIYIIDSYNGSSSFATIYSVG